MNLTSKRNIKNLLKKELIRPSRKFGQNFLVDRKILKKIIEAADLKSTDTVLEIGPGLGTLTIELAKRVKQVIAIEKDLKMCGILKKTLKGFNNTEVIYSDILKSEFPRKSDFSKSYKVVANLPYYIVSPVIRQFLTNTGVSPLQMTLMIQKEVGQRICARPPKMSLLAVSVQFYAKPKILSYVSKKSFWPRPKVNSAIIQIDPQINSNRKQINADLFFKIVKAGFSQPRKQLINNLSKGLKFDKKKVELWLLKNNIQPTQRAETLNIRDWTKLTRRFSSF